MAPRTGFEPVTRRLEGDCSIQLSYRGSLAAQGSARGAPPALWPRQRPRTRSNRRNPSRDGALTLRHPIPTFRALPAVGVAQLVRAPDCDSGGRGFDSRRPPHHRRPARSLARTGPGNRAPRPHAAVTRTRPGAPRMAPAAGRESVLLRDGAGSISPLPESDFQAVARWAEGHGPCRDTPSPNARLLFQARSHLHPRTLPRGKT